ncbi:hypothetical protein JIN84_12655 [Luteolibacter yonseiensis]|uniref:Uncharacterized protein n=1 Tax=Luteolibacter yonseiensis TaxID=1144680 RepID=A0A934R7D6_9BACT|nr:hypothetical protein [Luteolibacter yonseiensis]MBK1816469.1 hypothetical protein [Luteolibacter yonseiensis]
MTVKPQRPAGAPEWIFRWRGDRQPLFPKLVAVAVAASAFTFLITVVRVKVDSPEKTALRRGSLIYFQNDVQGRTMALRASEGGPFPSRFELSQWQGLPALEAAAMTSVRYQAPPYVPDLKDIKPLNLVGTLRLAARGESFFPENRVTSPGTTPVGEMKVAPFIYPLSGVAGEVLPAELPAFTAEVDAGKSSTSWRFLVRLNAAGSVAECVSLEKGGEPGAAELEAWLQRIIFKEDFTRPSRWISVGIGFTNQPADGTDAR